MDIHTILLKYNHNEHPEHTRLTHSYCPPPQEISLFHRVKELIEDSGEEYITLFNYPDLRCYTFDCDYITHHFSEQLKGYFQDVSDEKFRKRMRDREHGYYYSFKRWIKSLFKL